MTEQLTPAVRRRTILKAAAWGAPIVMVGTAAPAIAASVPCIPAVQIVLEGSYTCCSGLPRDVQLVLQFTDSDTCAFPPGTRWCIDQIQLGVGSNPIVWIGQFCGEVNGLPIGPITICDTPDCTLTLIARIYPEGTTNPQLVLIKSDNIPAGQDLPQGTDCGCAYPS
jgi:hypothetical protein